MEKMKCIDETTPIGTEVIVVSAMVVPAVMFRTVTRSEPWRLAGGPSLAGRLVVLVKGKSGCYGAEFVYVLPPPVAP